MRTIALLPEHANSAERNERALDFVALGVANAVGGSLSNAERLFRQLRPRSNHDIVVRASVAAGRTTDAGWAGPLVELRPLASGFVELLRPLTIFDRLQPKMRRAPFEVRFPRQTSGASVGWLAEGKPMAFSQLAFESLTFAFAKLGGAVAVTQELARFASPDALQMIATDLLAATALATDEAFLNPESGGVAGQTPPAVTYSGPTIVASGSDVASFRKDTGALVAQMAAAGCQFQSPTWVMSEVQRFAIDVADSSLIKDNALGSWPIMTSQTAATAASPPTGNIYLLDAAQITYGDAGAEIDGTQEATLQMASPADDPTTPATVMRSLWGDGLAAVRAIRYLNWSVRAGCPAGTVTACSYGVA